MSGRFFPQIQGGQQILSEGIPIQKINLRASLNLWEIKISAPSRAVTWVFAGLIAAIPFPDRNAVPSGVEAWAQGRSGDGTSLRFVIGRGRGWCGVPRRASLTLGTPGLHDTSPLGLVTALAVEPQLDRLVEGIIQ